MRSRTESTGCDVCRRTCARSQLPGMVAPSALQGQGTVEYALITMAFLAIAICLGVLWRFVSEGGFVADVTGFLTHRLAKGVADIVLF